MRMFKKSTFFVTLLFFLSLLSSFPAIQIQSTALSGVYEAEAGQMDDTVDRQLSYKRFLMNGEVSYSFEDIDMENRSGGASSSSNQYSLIQDYNLSFTSYVYHPHLLTYTAGFDWVIGSGTFDFPDSRAYSLNLDILKAKPFNFSLRGQYIDGEDYDTDQEGITLRYSRERKKLTFRNMREWSIYNSMMRASMKNNQNNNGGNNSNNNNNNNNANYNNQGASDNQGGVDEDEENRLNSNQTRPEMMRQAGLLDNVLPTAYEFDFDRYGYRGGEGRDSTSYSSTFTASGDYQGVNTRTNYALNLGYLGIDSDYEEGRDRKYTSRFDSVTNLGKEDTFAVRLSHDISDYPGSTEQALDTAANATYTGFLDNRKWNYNISAQYGRTEYFTTSDSMTVAGFAGSSSDFGRIKASYNFGGLYQKYSGIGEANYALTASGSAGTMLNRKTSLTALSNIAIGTESTSYGAGLESRYAYSRHLSLFGSYDYSNTSGQYASINGNRFAGQGTHQFRAGANGFINDTSLNSLATYISSDSSESLTWSNSLNTVLFYFLRFSFSADLSREKGQTFIAGAGQGSEAVTRARFYSSMGMSPWYQSALNMNAGYSKVLSGPDERDYYISPSLGWRIRKLFLSAEYKYDLSERDNYEQTEQRFLLRLTRPFWL